MKAIILKTNNLLSDPSTPPADLKKLVKELKAEMEFGLALKVLKRLEEAFPKDLLKTESGEKETAVWVQQQKALCTYKDENLHPSVRLPEALKILEDTGLTEPEQNDPKTLGLGGAVYKRLWEYRGRIEDIYSSLALYRLAWTRDPKNDMGYGGVNAAFILDILADRAKKAAERAGNKKSDEADRLEREASELRHEMLERIAEELKTKEDRDKNYWYPVTLAEINMGLRKYTEAGNLLAQAKKLAPSAWEIQTTAKQLISIIKIQGFAVPASGTPWQEWHTAWKALRELLEDCAEEVIHSHRGKIELALSGGGFRASLFHLGVLARLAEMDVLRSVEVLSTVSGGSIIGAYYYLELKNLLEPTENSSLTREDYVNLIRRVLHNFLCAVQKNLRVRAIGGPWANLKILFLPGYTRSIRLAELYQKYIFNKVPAGPSCRKTHAMSDLMIAPMGGGPKKEFNPAKANWCLAAKVPVLLINTTTLNSGHNYHFTAKFMGEPPGLTGFAVDMNARYRRVYYEDIGEPSLRQYPLGRAVGASACVPGLFEPLELKRLYPGHEVRLVDGGVHDNQGVTGLLDEGCSIILCSDASGQMDDQARPKAGRLGVIQRSFSIYMDRVREAEYQDLAGREESGSLEGLFFIHLKKDLEKEPVDWIDCDDPTPPQIRPNTTPYNIDRDIQSRLSELRTDLDSFTDVEAYALMMSGYEMTRQQFEQLALTESHGKNNTEWKGFRVDAPAQEWPFFALRDIMKKPKNSPQGP